MLRLMTCNIRTSAAWDQENAWPLRRQLCCDIIASRHPDVICCQEVRQDQATDLREWFGAEYATFGLPDEAAGHHPMNLMLYRRATVRVVASGGFWLSETPHVPGSRSWDSACVRVANWLRLHTVEGNREFAVANTHLDHMSQVAREKQADMINQWALAWADEYPRLLAGDLNANPENPVIRSLLAAGWQDTYETIHGDIEPTYTCHGFRGENLRLGEEPWARRIDWILSRGAVEPLDAEIVRDRRDARYPSDHYFLTADVRFP